MKTTQTQPNISKFNLDNLSVPSSWDIKELFFYQPLQEQPALTLVGTGQEENRKANRKEMPDTNCRLTG